MIDDIGRDDLLGGIDSLKEGIAELEAEARFRKMEVAIWKGATELAKKDPGINPERLIDKEKAILVDAPRTTFPLNELLGYPGLARSSSATKRRPCPLLTGTPRCARSFGGSSKPRAERAGIERYGRA